ncbi:hypothetical protein BTW15_03035 [Pseudomonas syringae pv. tomato]|nr:hypothetical protein XJ28_17775 [Pseudomonas syringae pv. tomato]EEB60653.1 hypothetical protein PSPTOT1_5009 [Pseudomonas syringae pv. tomato T1]QBI62821.1 hypothetical protein EIZ61_15820 [Pseudomonas syringae]OPE61678.1 hypothetical protein BTW15_03035 [Pseudomonas syringae pv. tomato]RMQ73382.1 hypothetical protein ALP99_04506 [Pseudomonas syringae pv. tomato]
MLPDSRRYTQHLLDALNGLRSHDVWLFTLRTVYPMAILIRINVVNNSQNLQNLYFFQQPAAYTGGPEVYSNSLLSTPILPTAQGGSSYSFLLNLQYYAGAQQRTEPPALGQPSGFSSAIQPIDLTTAAGGAATNNATTMQVLPALGLSVPANVPAVQAGAFRIKVPTYNPALEQYNGGSAVKIAGGSVVLSNFVTLEPTTNLDCQPILKFYVQTGTYTAGTVMNFTSASIDAALCDATTGFTTFDVSYNADGTWTVNRMASVTVLETDHLDQHIVNAVDLNTEILNEAGTAIISLGHADHFNTPFAVTNLTNPAGLTVHHEYQVRHNGGHPQGHICTALNGNTATFS